MEILCTFSLLLCDTQEHEGTVIVLRLAYGPFFCKLLAFPKTLVGVKVSVSRLILHQNLL